MKNKLPVFVLITFFTSVIFAFLQLSFNVDISLVAFPLALAFIVFFGWIFYFKFIKNFHPLNFELNIEKLPIVIKLLQYLPYVLLTAFVFRRAGENSTSHTIDIITVVLWLIASVSSRLVLFVLNPKRFYKFFPEFKEFNKKIKRTFGKKVVYEIFDWVDAFVQAICTVALFNIFIFQLYEIPSESMVSEFLVRDRVVGWKLDAGPKFPLSDVGIPELKDYKRGDIVIFSNPHYSSDRDSQVKTFLSQLVYMLTLTTVNLNVDEDGNLKADPLVKRIAGEEGEQLVMQDGILYARTAENPTFTKVSEDELWAKWNLNELPKDLLQKVQRIPLSEEIYDSMIEVEETRRNLDIPTAITEAKTLAEDFANLKKSFSGNYASAITVNDFTSADDLHVYNFFSYSDNLIRTLYYSNGGENWFTAFMTDWIDSMPQDANGFIGGGDVYSEAMYKNNLLLKLNFGRLAVRTAELLSNNVSSNEQNYDAKRMAIIKDFQKVANYMLSLNDMRNMEVFPANVNGEAQYISKDNFFLMGDNRFNSLDMRHSYEYTLKAITKFDPWSLHYDSNLAPQQVSTDSILGSPILRFYPFNRFKIIKNGTKN